MSMFREKKPYSAVTVQIDRLCSEQYAEDDFGGIIDLVEVIRIQQSGPTEAARALRKKLKYGDRHKQIRALNILDGLIQNAGSRFQRTFADEPLLERLRLMAHEDMTDPDVRKKCQVLYVQWANAYQGTPGLERIANLYKEFPKTQRPAQARQKVLRDSDLHDSDAESPFGGGERARAPAASPVVSSSSGHARASSGGQPSVANAAQHRPVTLTPTSTGFGKLSKSKSKFSSSGGKPFNLNKEKENMTNCIARSSIASTNLLNALQLVNREQQRVSENAEVRNRFEMCKTLRRQILVYIQHVESDDWIGSLVNANDELIKALTAYEIMDRSLSDDSDSDVEAAVAASKAASHSRGPSAETAAQLAGLNIQEQAPPIQPPRPAAPPASVPMPAKPAMPEPSPAPEEDEDDPFGDSNAVPTPAVERPGMTWREV